jgi:methylase of polypeptide subunit release factors
VKRQPREALLSPENGTFFYRRICQEAADFLASQFLLIMEISPGLPKNWLKLVIKHFPQAKVEIFPDRNGDNRVIAVYKIK